MNRSLLFSLIAATVFASSLFAQGNVIFTGRDADFWAGAPLNISGLTNAQWQNEALPEFGAIVSIARKGSNLPILVIADTGFNPNPPGQNQLPLQSFLVMALQNLSAPINACLSNPPGVGETNCYVWVNPSTTPIPQPSPAQYSAIGIASVRSGPDNGDNTVKDAFTITAAAANIGSFVNQGGGLFVMTSRGIQSYYNLLIGTPLATPSTFDAPTQSAYDPQYPTPPVGNEVNPAVVAGLMDAPDILGHNLFVSPPPSDWQTLETFTGAIQAYDGTPGPAVTGQPLTVAYVGPSLVVSSPQSFVGTAGVALANQNLAATAGSPPYTWSATNLPAWLTVTPAGALAGTPPTIGTFTFTATAKDSGSVLIQSGSTTVNVNVVPPPLVVPSPQTLTGTAGLALVNQNLGAAGGIPPYTWKASGQPVWLTVSPTGAVTGTPPLHGTFTFTATVTDSGGSAAQSGQTTVVVNIAAPVLVVPSPQTLTGIASLPLSNQNLTASGGTPPYTWKAIGQPAWLTVGPTGVVTGTPPLHGTFTFTATVTDSGGSAVQSAQTTVVVNIAAPALVVPSPQTLTGVAGLPLSNQNLTASGGTSPYTWKAEGQPAWLTVSSTGVVTGTPPSHGTFTFTATITDSGGSAVQSGQTTVVVNIAAPALVAPTPQTLTGIAGVPLSNQNLTASGGTPPYSWKAEGQPAWLTVSTAGIVIGTPPAHGSFTFFATVTDSGGSAVQSSSIIVILNIAAPPLVVPSPQTLTGIAGLPLSNQNLTASGGTPPYTWKAEGQPAWLTVSPTGVVNGTPPLHGTYTFTATITDSGGSAVQSGQTTVVVNIAAPALVVPTPQTLTGIAGVPLSNENLTASGGTPPYTWKAEGQPAWLTVSTAGIVTGTPPTHGSFTFTATITDSGGSAVQSSSIIVILNIAAPPLVVPSPQTLIGTAGLPLSNQNLTASGGTPPYTWKAEGQPAWLTVSTAGIVTGTPPTHGSFTFTATITDSGGSAVQSSSIVVVLNVAAPTLVVPSPQTLIGTAGVPLSNQNLTASGGTPPYTWKAINPPAWLTVSTAGVVTGTPPTHGTFTFNATITDSGGSAVQSEQTTVVVNIAAPALVVPSPQTLTGIAGLPLSNQNLTASGGTPPYTWKATDQPAWLTVSATGAVTGTPPLHGTFTFTATVMDSGGSAEQSVQVTVIANIAAPALVVPSPQTLTGVAGLPLSNQNLTASGGTPPYTWKATGQPSWLTVSAIGALSGTPPSHGTFTFTATVTDSGGSAVQSVQVTVVVNVAAALVVPPLQTLTGVAGLPISNQNLTASGGTPPYTWKATGQPAWLTVSTTGALTGTPPASGTFTFTATVTDSGGSEAQSGQTTVTLKVAPAALTVPSPQTFTGIAGLPLADHQTLTASGGTPPYKWVATGQPAWLTVSSNGSLSGTPPALGSFTFTATITDSGATSPQSGHATVTLTVIGGTLVVPSSPTFTGVVGVPLANQSLTASGGTSPYTWQATGQPSWLTVASTGLLTGTPPSSGTFTFTAVVTDSQPSVPQTAQSTVTVQIAQFAPTGLTLSLTPAQPTPVDQPQVLVSVTNSSSLPLSGFLVLTGPSDARFLSSNPSFVSSNGKTLCFPIPANSSGPVTTLDDSGQYMLGTVAGTITVTLNSITEGSCPAGTGPNLITGSPLVATQTVAPSVPIISAVMASGSPTAGITIVVTGFSNTKDLASAAFSFTSPVGALVNGANQTVPLSPYAAPFFASSADGSFEYTQTFPYSGDATAFPPSVSVTVTNSVGASSPTSAAIAP